MVKCEDCGNFLVFISLEPNSPYTGFDRAKYVRLADGKIREIPFSLLPSPIPILKSFERGTLCEIPEVWRFLFAKFAGSQEETLAREQKLLWVPLI